MSLAACRRESSEAFCAARQPALLMISAAQRGCWCAEYDTKASCSCRVIREAHRERAGTVLRRDPAELVCAQWADSALPGAVWAHGYLALTDGSRAGYVVASD
jgi:hypothetical protein